MTNSERHQVWRIFFIFNFYFYLYLKGVEDLEGGRGGEADGELGSDGRDRGEVGAFVFHDLFFTIFFLTISFD